MIRALFKKQMMEVFSWLFKDKKSGKLRTSKGVAVYALFYLLLFGLLGVVFGFMAAGICGPLLKSGMGWLYWCLMGLVAIFLGVFGSVFNTYSSLYQAKDNDLLLSMPIPVSYILLARLSGVYAMGLTYELIVMIPAMIVWLASAPLTFFGTIHVLLIPLVLSMLILVFSAVLGWAVAMITAKMKRKNIISVIASLAFIAAYYYLYSKAYSILQDILANAAQFGEKIRSILYPLYHMGMAAEGSVLSMLLFTAMVGLLLAAVFWVLSGNFLHLATTNPGSAKAVYRERSAKASSVRTALLKKELRRFTGSANYMLNCGLGIILMPVSAILLLWKADVLRPFLSLLSPDELALLAIGAMCLLVSMNDMIASSVSLEGRNLWIVQSLPVSGRQVLAAKLKMQLLLTLIPALAPMLAIVWIIRPKVLYVIALPIITVLFALLMAAIGLAGNLKMPSLHWSSEIVPIKQSVPTTIALLGGWVIVTITAGGYFLLHEHVTALTFAVFAAMLLLAADCILLRWIMDRGAEIFERLQ